MATVLHPNKVSTDVAQPPPVSLGTKTLRREAPRSPQLNLGTASSKCLKNVPKCEPYEPPSPVHRLATQYQPCQGIFRILLRKLSEGLPCWRLIHGASPTSPDAAGTLARMLWRRCCRLAAGRQQQRSSTPSAIVSIHLRAHRGSCVAPPLPLFLLRIVLLLQLPSSVANNLLAFLRELRPPVIVCHAEERCRQKARAPMAGLVLVIRSLWRTRSSQGR